jgi:secondary thiamine-phosphate synthase enzyme
MTALTLKTTERFACLDVTESVAEIVRASGVQSGLCHVMVLHATAAIVVNENDDPNIGVDLLAALDRMIPLRAGWLHDRIDGNAHAHLKAAILGPSETLAIEAGELVLGRWQGIMLVELDGPRERTVSVHCVSGSRSG